ncbi:MAG TPA: site-2 protease family protein [Vicinamibacterales bacterium]|nr:site-2 protease family protein [Vicinamibacterales bacterium]
MDPLPPVPNTFEGRVPTVFEGLPVTYTSPRKFQDRRWLHLTLFVLTLASTTLMGTEHFLAFASNFGRNRVVFTIADIAQGLWYSATVLIILGAHELGHYLACRYYQVDASLPFFIPMPGVLTGTLGAFIRIREPIPTKRMLFDIGIAGPLAGFVFAVPALFIGIALSPVVRVPENLVGFNLGEPLLFRIAAWLTWGSIGDGYSLNMHPMALAAWFGLLATALNLFPIGQLDGGHISYAVLGRRSTAVTLASICVAIALTFFSMSWLVWTFLLVAMTLVMGPRHPRTTDEDVPLDRARVWLAVVALAIFVLCFTANPIEPTQLLRR